ncbi:MAG TPA: Cof-type HAD-IIB family hydrolase [Candidatus Baltobacteraceae bacterium]|nr:Cof-type HAD-IIB family hydrolase [Candidatus Baltobacteraceae bacterium]
MFKLVALDVDGTLVGRDLTISKRVRDAVERMQRAGVVGCLVTGRMYRATLPFARELGFDAPLVCYQGAAVIDPVTDEILHHAALDNGVVRDLIADAQAKGMHLQLYRNDEYYCESRNRFSDLYASLAMTQPVVVPSLRETFAYSAATKAVVVADAPDALRYAGELAQLLGNRAYITRSLPEFVELLDPQVDKGDALRLVAQRLGASMDQVLAVGDSWNDAPLLRAAGFGVAMGSAPPELREVADAVVGDVAHDGVAEAIERYVLA